jgi:hypothetical protein
LELMKAAVVRSFLLSSLLLVVGCGRYRAPLSPELLAPRPVTNLEVVGQDAGVRLSWRAPEEDRRGKELKAIDGYQVQRKEIVNRGDETAVSVKFQDLVFVRDSHIVARDKLRAEARAAGKIGRTVQSPEELTVFGYLDSTARKGSNYIYQVVPQNQGGTDGVVAEVARVLFMGPQSEVDILAADEVAEQKLLLATTPDPAVQDNLVTRQGVRLQ